jgi:hypothetical protein
MIDIYDILTQIAYILLWGGAGISAICLICYLFDNVNKR